ncbi:MAG: hypothetical protein LBU28_04670 [Spirochaetaceae bacterium]|jgi:hypothetical protein|nr:hypothetical protein [Spirochaetaceae bacterium]
MVSALGMASLLEGPRLGPYYDFLVKHRPSPAISDEITLIETGGNDRRGRGEFFARNFIEAETAASVLMILTEFDASGLVLRIPLLGASGLGKDEAELTDRFEEEFGLLEGNIRNLFEAIRLGSIHPAAAEGYVGELIRLTEGGKERLLAALFRDDESRAFEGASAAFGRDRIAGAVPDRGGAAGLRADGDGVLRRIRPLVSQAGAGSGWEHSVYTLLKGRYEKAALEEAPGGPILRLVARGGEARIIPLDSEGAVLVEGPGKDQDFRRLPLGAFARYEAADRELYQALAAASPLGVYGELNPEAYPPILYEYALSLREELLRSPDEEGRSRWREGRAAYFAALEDLCYGPWEMRLVSAYEERIGAGGLEPEEVRELEALRDEVIRTFVGIRDRYRNFMEIKELLRLSLASSLCILGPGGDSTPGVPDIVASGMLASSLLTGTVIRPGSMWLALLWSLGIALVVCLVLVPMGPLLSLGAGFFLTALSWGGFSWAFVLSSCWIDPLIPSSAALGGALASSLFMALIRLRTRGRIRRAYGAVLPPSSLKVLFRSGALPSPEPLTDYAVIAAVRSGAMMDRERRGDPRGMALEAASFREEILRWCREAGAVMAGWEGDAALVAFGSSLEREFLSPADGDGGLIPRALGLIQAAPSPAGDGGGSWYFGIDAGPCSFTYTPDAGYRVYGSAAIRARGLSVLAFRYRLRLLVTAAVKEGAAFVPSWQLKIPLGKEGEEICYAPEGSSLTGSAGTQP